MKKPIVWLAAVAAVAIAAVVVGMKPAGTDTELIKSALKESIVASKEGRPGGVLELLSAHIAVNSNDESGHMAQITRYIKENRPDVSIPNQTPIVTGDDATINSPIDVTINLLGQSKTIHLKDALLKFHKESETHWLVFPASKWRLAEVDAQDLSGFGWDQ